MEIPVPRKLPKTISVAPVEKRTHWQWFQYALAEIAVGEEDVEVTWQNNRNERLQKIV